MDKCSEVNFRHLFERLVRIEGFTSFEDLYLNFT